MPNGSALLWARVGLQAYPPKATHFRAYGCSCFSRKQGENTCPTEGVFFQRRIFVINVVTEVFNRPPTPKRREWGGGRVFGCLGFRVNSLRLFRVNGFWKVDPVSGSLKYPLVF